jgi:response regulator of citrate/malate metabolism
MMKTLREAMDRGAVDYMTKPLDLNYLDTRSRFS